jgi:hypothetical protein
MNLELSLFQKQIDAAARLHKRLPQWQLPDAALIALHENLPGFESAVCLLKSAAVIAIYGTNVLAIALLPATLTRSHIEDS